MPSVSGACKTQLQRRHAGSLPIILLAICAFNAPSGNATDSFRWARFSIERPGFAAATAPANRRTHASAGCGRRAAGSADTASASRRTCSRCRLRRIMLIDAPDASRPDRFLQRAVKLGRPAPCCQPVPAPPPAAPPRCRASTGPAWRVAAQTRGRRRTDQLRPFGMPTSSSATESSGRRKSGVSLPRNSGLNLNESTANRFSPAGSARGAVCRHQPA